MNSTISVSGVPPVNGTPPNTYVNGDGQAHLPVDNAGGGRVAPPTGRSVNKRRGADPFDDLLWRLHARQDDAALPCATLGLVGCESRAGVTTIAANLAIRAAELRVGPALLVETAVDRPRLRKAWRLRPGPGLAELMSGAASYADCIYEGPTPDLHVIPAAADHRGEPVAWDAGAIEALLAEACADHRLVLFDLASAEQLRQTMLLARRLHQVLLVVRAESTRSAVAQRVAERLADDGVPLSGAVLNRSRSYVPGWLRRWI